MRILRNNIIGGKELDDISLFICPVCSNKLFVGEKQYYCKNGHSYDIARNSYVNLLLPKHIGSGNPGDKKEMIRSRREFLNKGYYNVLVPQIEVISHQSKHEELELEADKNYVLDKWSKELNNDPFYNPNYSNRRGFVLDKKTH
jgi:hypothetical protein